MTSIRRSTLAGQNASATDPALEGWRLHAALIGEIPRVRRYATAWLGDAAAADGLVQEAIERVIAPGEAPDEPHQLRVRMLGLLHDLHERGAQPAPADGAAGLRGLTLHLHAHAAQAERAWMQALAAAVEQLPDEPRQALLLTALEGLSYRDTADVLGVPLGTAMSHLATAREEVLAQTRGPEDAGPSDRGVDAGRSAVTELDLHAYLDNELGADRVQTVEAFLQARPRQAERLQALAEQDEMVRKLYGPLLSRSVPVELLAPLLTVTPGPVGRRFDAATIVAAVGLLLLGLIAGCLLCS